MTAVEAIAEWICSVRYEDIPERVIERARWQIESVLAAIAASAHSQDAIRVRDAVMKWAKPGACTVFANGERLGLHDAVTINTAWSMALDYDDYLYMGHTGHSAVLASWAIAESEKLSTRELLTAQVVANEIGGRIGASAVLGPQNGQAWSFIHAVEAAAVAAKLWKLDSTQTANALAISLYQPSFTLWPGFMGPGSKVLTASAPTITGLSAAAFAREGMTGAREIIEHPRKGFWSAFAWVPLPEMLTGLGQAWVSDTLTYKRYPGCAYVDTTLDALLRILAEFRDKKGRDLVPAEVRRVEVDANLLTIEMDNLSSEHVSQTASLSPINVNFSVPFNVAIAIAAGAHEGRTLAQSFLDGHEREIRELADKTTLQHDWSLSLEVARAFEGVLGRSGVLATLGARDVLALVQGYRKQLGGRKKTGLGFGRLLKGSPKFGDVLRQAGRRRAVTARSDLSSVDFTRFKMTFPVRVTLETANRERYSARQDVPFGAPGQTAQRETVHEKLVRELPARLSSVRAASLIEGLAGFERASITELSALFGV